MRLKRRQPQAKWTPAEVVGDIAAAYFGDADQYAVRAAVIVRYAYERLPKSVLDEWKADAETEQPGRGMPSHGVFRFDFSDDDREVAEVIRWSCKSPGGTYRYVITARSNVGPTLTRHGHFVPVSVTTCHQYEQKEAEARASHEREAIAGYEQEVREERERRERYETNCRKLGGEPVELQVGSEYRIYCRAPGGGTIPVPY